jgi:hypothetical protein
MKTLFLTFCFLLPFSVVQTGCGTTQVQQAQTLEAVGVAAKLTIDTAAILLAENKISVQKFQDIARFYDNKFQPAFRIALAHVEGNTKNPAPLQLVSLAAELSNLLK